MEGLAAEDMPRMTESITAMPMAEMEGVMELAGRQEKEVTRKAVAQGKEVQQKNLGIREQTFIPAAVVAAMGVLEQAPAPKASSSSAMQDRREIMRHAVIDKNTVVNIIEIDPRNASDFGNAVTIPEGVGAGIGDTYREGRFYRTDPETQQEEEILPFDPLAETHKRLAEVQAKLDESIIDTDFRILMLESLSASNL